MEASLIIKISSQVGDLRQPSVYPSLSVRLPTSLSCCYRLPIDSQGPTQPARLLL